MTDLIFNADICVSRADPKKPGKYINGIFVGGKTKIVKMEASIQPLSPNEILQLPEGRRTEESYKVFTCEQLFPTDEKNQVQGDIFDYKGKTFEVHKTEDWTDFDLPHYKSIIIKRDGEGSGR